MNILMTEASRAMGGQELAVVRQTEGLTQRGHEVTLLVRPGSPIEQLAVRKGIRVRPLRMQGFTPAAIDGIRRLLLDERPHVVHVNSSRDSWAGAIAARLVSPRIPVVKSRHISTALNRNLPTRLLYRYLFDHIIVTGGPSTRHALIQRDGLAPHRVSAFPIGVDVSRFQPASPAWNLRARLGVSPDCRLVGIVSYLRSYKGHHYFIEAAHRVLRREKQVVFLIVGEGPEEEAIRNHVRALGISREVLLLGYQEDLCTILRSLDVFVMPSVEGDTIPQVMLEAMATGLPVVATTTGAIADVIEHGTSGLLVPPRDADALAACVEQLLADVPRRKALAQAGCSVVRSQYSFDVMLTRLEAVYQAVQR